MRFGRAIWIMLLGIVVGCRTGGPETGPDATVKAREVIAQHVAAVRPLELTGNRAWWNANLSGKDEDFKAKEEAENQLDSALLNRDRFTSLQNLRKARITDPMTRRQVEVLYLAYLEKQVDPDLLKKMNQKDNAVEQAFNVYRAKVNGKELTDSQVREVLRDSRDSAYRKAVWEASKGVGAVVETDLKQLVTLRNQAARTLGFGDYHKLQLFLNEQRQEDVLRLFDELDALTRRPYEQAKAAMDKHLAKRYGVAASDLMPWHYTDPFFQEPPPMGDASLDAPYAGADLVKLTRDYYASIGLPIDDVLARSDLYEKPGKSPHAFCTDIDREGDVRVLANVVSNYYWAGTMLHEFGHAAYSKFVPRSMPYVLRSESHILTTEGIAMMMERPVGSADWLKRMNVPVADPAAFNRAGRLNERNQLLVFSRWCQVMFRFEKEMYAHPDQDLNALWWGLVEKYQGLRRPEGRNAPDYAAKIHIVTSPAYYHNYLLGQLFASQLHHTIAREVLHTSPAEALYVGRPEVGEFLKRKVFAPGRSLSWNELAKFATGKPLNPKAFAADFSE